MSAHLESVRRATGSARADIGAGHIPISITMNPLAPGLYKIEGGEYTPVGITTLANAEIHINSNEGDYLYLLDESTAAAFSINPASATTLTLQGYEAGHTILLGSTMGTLFTVLSNKTLILDRITLQGNTSNNDVFIKVNAGGPYLWKRDRQFKDNISTSTGSGVLVNSGAFTMNSGATIAGNQAASGGDVAVNSGGVSA